nr:RNA-directed DNA polymerase, eukaryota, reverse transcriptase zinc-binding domain protein [Tanacetum cinerariifolium]
MDIKKQLADAELFFKTGQKFSIFELETWSDEKIEFYKNSIGEEAFVNTVNQIRRDCSEGMNEDVVEDLSGSAQFMAENVVTNGNTLRQNEVKAFIKENDSMFWGIIETQLRKKHVNKGYDNVFDPDEGILKKLDRVMGNNQFTATYPTSIANFLSYLSSDHCLVVLTVPKMVRRKPRSFRFMNYLADKKEFLDVVKDKWNLNIACYDMFKLVKRLKALKAHMRNLNKKNRNVFYKVKFLKIELARVQECLDRDPHDSYLREEEMIYAQAYKDASIDEEKLAVEIIKPITSKEIKDALFSIDDNKASEPDGYTSKFFKAAWSVVGHDVCSAVKELFDSGMILGELNSTLISLVPKVSSSAKITDYRPNSCCNVIYKTISKVITNRIKPVLCDLVYLNQSTFILGRLISDNILLAHEFMKGYNWDIKVRNCAFKVDIQKAYDIVSWEFLSNVLKMFSFHPVIIHWVMTCLTNASFSVCVNGETHGFFRAKRGLRQGDQVSPYLFTLVMEVLNLMVKRQIRRDRSFK